MAPFKVKRAIIFTPTSDATPFTVKGLKELNITIRSLVSSRHRPLSKTVPFTESIYPRATPNFL